MPSRGRAIETDQIARRLGVRYILSGSVRKSGPRVRVSAQLVEAETGGSIWAERYDRDLTDILALQDEISEAVAGAIEPELLKKEGQRGSERSQSASSWDLVRRGMWEFHKIRPDSHREARELFQKAIDADPNSADGYLWLARVEGGFAAYGWSDDPEDNLRDGMEAALRAVQLDEKNPYTHYAVAITHTFAGRCDVAIQAAQRAIALSPSFALGYLVVGAAHLHAGHAQEAIEPLEHGLRLSPFDPQNFSWLVFLAVAYYFAGRPDEGLANIRRALSLRPGWAAALKIAAICALGLGDEPQAQAAFREMRASPETGGDLTRIILSLNPEWAKRVEMAVRQIEEKVQ